MRFAPDRCPRGELLKTLPGLHPCLRGEAAAIVLSVPRGPWAAATQPKCCPCCHVPSITLEGWAAVSLWSPLVCHSHWDSFHAIPWDTLQDGQGWKLTLQLLVANDAFIIQARSLAAFVGISDRSCAWTSSFEVSQLHPVTSTICFIPSNEAGSLQTSRATKTQRGMRTPLPMSGPDKAAALRKG